MGEVGGLLGVEGVGSGEAVGVYLLEARGLLVGLLHEAVLEELGVLITLLFQLYFTGVHGFEVGQLRLAVVTVKGAGGILAI